MSGYVDFSELKRSVSIETAADYLSLAMRRSGDQWRGPCPACKSAGPRALAINTAKQSYYCFGQGRGGDVIALAAHVLGKAMKEAAQELARASGTVHSGTVPQRGTVPGTVPATSPPARETRRPGFDAAAYAAKLDPDHEALEPIGVSSDTLRRFQAGYSLTGLNRGRLALPVHDMAGHVVAYVGRAIEEDQQPLIVAPNGFDLAGHLFNGVAVGDGELSIVRDPLSVLTAYEAGIENCVAYLTETITAHQLEILASLMDERKVSSIGLF